MQEVLTYPGVVYLWNKISQKFDEKNTSLTVDSAPTSATVSYVDALGNTKNHIVGDKRVVPNNARPSGQDIYILVSITQGVANWINLNDNPDLAVVNRAFPSNWRTTGTMAQLITDINNDTTAIKGRSYLSTVSLSDLPSNLLQAEMLVYITNESSSQGKTIFFMIVSSNTAPYHWEYTSANGATGAWRSFALNDHTHGNITNDGKLQTTDINIASGDKLVVTDSSDNNKISRTSAAFDGTTTDKALTPKGTFEDFLQEDDIADLATKEEAGVVIDSNSFVDLGLPSGTLWATMNIGATQIYEEGNYYKFGSGSAQFYKSDDYSVPPYYTGLYDELAPGQKLPLEYDSARQELGGNWYTPTMAQFEELGTYTDFEWTVINGHYGGKFTSKTDNTKFVFFPAAGSFNYNADVIPNYSTNSSATCEYQTSSLYERDSNPQLAYMSLFSGSTQLSLVTKPRFFGAPVRPVCDSTPIKSKKADKVENAVNGNLAGLNSDGNITDSGISASNVLTYANRGAALGVASLDALGKVPSSQLPSYVDDVIELLTMASSAPATCAAGDLYFNTTSGKIFTASGTNTWGSTGANPEKSKIYTDLSTNTTYRWGGSTMVEISKGLEIGTTTGTAADGGVVNTHINNTSNPHNVTKAQIGLGNVDNKSSETIKTEVMEDLEEVLTEIEDVTAAALTDLDERLERAVKNLGNVNNNLKTVNEKLLSLSNAESLTYAELGELKENGLLVPGKWYRITDYTVIANSNEQKIADGHQFDLLVMAIASNALSEEAKAVEHSSGGRLYKTSLDSYPDEIDRNDYFQYIGTFEFDNNTYYQWQKYEQGEETDVFILTERLFTPGELSLSNPEMNYIEIKDDERYDYHVGEDGLVLFEASSDPYFSNINLSSWELKYCFDNDTDRFSWADSENGKGVIYQFNDGERIIIIDPAKTITIEQDDKKVDMLGTLLQINSESKGWVNKSLWGNDSQWI